MPKSDYIAQAAPAFAAQLTVFKNAIAPYGPNLGLSAAQIAEQAADADYYSYVIDAATVMQNGSSQWSTWKSLIRDGGAPPPSGGPVAPVLPAQTITVPVGIEGRFRALVRVVKASPAYNSGIGQALGIEGSESSGPDLNTITPDIALKVVGGQVVIEWGWQGYYGKLSMIEIQVDRGAGFSLLTYDSTPVYNDNTPLPATPAKWTYKAIYRKGDNQVGQWSSPVTITVGG